MTFRASINMGTMQLLGYDSVQIILDLQVDSHRVLTIVSSYSEILEIRICRLCVRAGTHDN